MKSYNWHIDDCSVVSCMTYNLIIIRIKGNKKHFDRMNFTRLNQSSSHESYFSAVCWVELYFYCRPRGLVVNCDVSSLHHRIAGTVSSTQPWSPVAGQAVIEKQGMDGNKERISGGGGGVVSIKSFAIVHLKATCDVFYTLIIHITGPSVKKIPTSCLACKEKQQLVIYTAIYGCIVEVNLHANHIWRSDGAPHNK